MLRHYGWSATENDSSESPRRREVRELFAATGQETAWPGHRLSDPARAAEPTTGLPGSHPTLERPRRLWWKLLILLAAAAILIAVVSRSSSPAGPTQPLLPATVPGGKVLKLKVRWNLFGARPFITVRVGNGRSVPVLLDTGSTGLHIYAAGVKLGRRSGVTVSGRPDSATYFDGTVQRGVIARARLTIDGVKTVSAVRFGLIDYVGCAHHIPCPQARGIGSDVARGEYGILGIGLRRNPDRLGNPLLALPRAEARGWSIVLDRTHGYLVVGVRDPARPLARFSLARDGRDPSGRRAWKDDRVHVCWAAVGLRGAGCEPTTFDTGSQIMFWYGGLMSHATTYPGSILVTPGTYVAAWHGGQRAPFWSFTAGTDASRDTVLALNLGHPGVIAAVQAFLTFDITYDAAHGEIFVARKPAGA